MIIGQSRNQKDTTSENSLNPNDSTIFSLEHATDHTSEENNPTTNKLPNTKPATELQRYPISPPSACIELPGNRKKDRSFDHAEILGNQGQNNFQISGNHPIRSDLDAERGLENCSPSELPIFADLWNSLEDKDPEMLDPADHRFLDSIQAHSDIERTKGDWSSNWLNKTTETDTSFLTTMSQGNSSQSYFADMTADNRDPEKTLVAYEKGMPREAVTQIISSKGRSEEYTHSNSPMSSSLRLTKITASSSITPLNLYINDSRKNLMTPLTHGDALSNLEQPHTGAEKTQKALDNLSLDSFSSISPLAQRLENTDSPNRSSLLKPTVGTINSSKLTLSSQFPDQTHSIHEQLAPSTPLQHATSLPDLTAKIIFHTNAKKNEQSESYPPIFAQHDLNSVHGSQTGSFTLRDTSTTTSITPGPPNAPKVGQLTITHRANLFLPMAEVSLHASPNDKELRRG